MDTDRKFRESGSRAQVVGHLPSKHKLQVQTQCCQKQTNKQKTNTNCMQIYFHLFRKDQKPRRMKGGLLSLMAEVGGGGANLSTKVGVGKIKNLGKIGSD
jgi:hypothetical protein